MKYPIVSVIMAGGTGERFWPVSRKNHPKQLLYLTSDEKVMIDEAVERLLPLVTRDHIFIATSEDLQQPIQEALPDHPKENIIGEPLRRNTTGALAFAAAHALARYGETDDLLMSVTTADHLIGETDRFVHTVSAALEFAENEDALVTIGVHPTRPETGYGYVEISNLNQPLSEANGIPIYEVKHFLEKPNLEDAERYQASRFYYWNSGMFFWRISTFMNSLNEALPSVESKINEMAELIKNEPDNAEALTNVFETLPDISIDYGLMEKAKNVYVALGDFRWDDVGSWDSLARFRTRDELRNTAVGNPIMIDCKNVTVYNEPGQNNMAVCTIGLEDMIVVTTKDAVLVCPKEHAQDVKKAVEILKSENRPQV